MSTATPLANSAGAPHVVILGGGIAGLSAAWHFRHAATALPVAPDVTVLESGERWGGKIQTTVDGSLGDPPLVLEHGADALLTRKPWALALAKQLGLEPHLTYVNQQAGRTFVLHHGRPVPIPAGTQLLVPARIRPFLRSPLFSRAGKARVLLDLVIPKRRSPADESLADFVTRRLGSEMLDRLAEPLLAGVYNAQADQQSLLATFPQFAAMERERRSLILAARAQTSKQRQVQPAQPTRSPAFFSFDGGTQMLVDALVTQLDASLRLGARVNGVHESERRLVVTLENSPDISCDAVIVATPAQATARVLRSAAPAVAAELGQMRTSSIGSAHLAFRTGDVPRPLGGIGLVIPASERRPIDGITWTSTKWLRRAPEGVSLLRVFFGGPHTRATFDLDDSHLIDVVRSELLTMFGIANAPLFSRVFRLADGYPCYDVGHLERVGRIEANLPGRIAVAGSAYHGVGVPDCVHSGQLAADKITGFLQGLPQPTQKVGGDAV